MIDEERERPVPPSSSLPPMKLIAHTPVARLLDAVDSLRQIYNPEVRGIWSDEPNSEEEIDVLTELRQDDFERLYAIRWLTSLIGLAEELDSRQPQCEVSNNETLEHEDDSVQALIASTASLLAACAGTASSGSVMRTYNFSVATPLRLGAPTYPPEKDSTVEIIKTSLSLSDAPLENGDYASVGAQTWGAAVVLSKLILENPGPSAFGIPLGQVNCTFHEMGHASSDHNSGGDRQRKFRVLELGAGTGLVRTLLCHYQDNELTIDRWDLQSQKRLLFVVLQPKSSLRTSIRVHWRIYAGMWRPTHLPRGE